MNKREGEVSGEGGHELGHYSGPNHLGEASSSPYPQSRLAAPIIMPDLAGQLARAAATVSTHTHARLSVIIEQVRRLEQEAQCILEKAKHDLLLHRAECRFQRRVGGVYHLYQRPDQSLHFSMLSPEDHGGRPPHRFLGSYRLEPDQSFTKLGDAVENQSTRVQVDELLKRKLLG